jgi:uncharacterized protein
VYLVTSATNRPKEDTTVDITRKFEPLALVLIVLGALNWLAVGLFDTDVVAEVAGTGTAADVLYVLVGLAGLVLLPLLLHELSGATRRPTTAA